MESSADKHLMIQWTPLRQWLIPLAILLAALFFHAVGSHASVPYYSVYVSLLMLAFMQPVINALRPNMMKNAGLSIAIFAIHAGICFFTFRLLNDQPAFDQQLFAAILVFYIMATMLSGLFRGILKLVTEVL
jgi:hypothetical protein